MKLISRSYFQSRVPFLIFAGGLAWMCVCLSAGVLLDPSGWFRLMYLALLVLAVVKPALGIGLFLVFMPWIGGSQPGDIYTIRFVLLLCGLSLGTIINSVWRVLVRGYVFEAPKENPMVFAFLVYWIVTAFSLTSVHPNSMLWALGSFNPDLSKDFMGLNEGFELYPWVSFVTLSLVTWLFIFLFNLFKTEPSLRRLMLLCLGGGALLSIFAGILDYFDFIDLAFVRVGGGERFRYIRLTAMFGNPTWYAQYVTICAPALLSVMLLSWKKSLSVTFMLIAMVITEFCIILINQRGGWLSYPLTIVVVWFCVYALDSDKAGKQRLWSSLKKSWAKITVTLPLTLVLSFSIIYLVAQFDTNGKHKVLGFVDRAQTITNANDRLAYFEPTVKLLRLHPIFGGGVDAFRHQYEKAFMVEGHRCQHDDPFTASRRGSAHNLYFQTLVGKGIVGLLSLLGLIVSAVFLCWRGVFAMSVSVRECGVTREQKISLMAGFAFALALAIYSNVGEIFYAPVNYMVLALFFAVGASAGDGLVKLNRWLTWFVCSILVCLLALHIYFERFAVFAC